MAAPPAPQNRSRSRGTLGPVVDVGAAARGGGDEADGVAARRRAGRGVAHVHVRAAGDGGAGVPAAVTGVHRLTARGAGHAIASPTCTWVSMVGWNRPHASQ